MIRLQERFLFHLTPASAASASAEKGQAKMTAAGASL